MSNSLSAWLDYIGAIHHSAIDLNLIRILPLAQKLQLTQFSCAVITVGGTNGKGTTVRALEMIYLAAGYRVAAYTSPQIIDFCERLRINGQMLDEAKWCEAFEFVEQQRGQLSLSFFEFITLAALWLCKTISLDVILLEVGLGGRFDAVNVVENDCAVITSIALDHTQWLGETREKIAFEKMGIVRKLCISGVDNSVSVITQECVKRDAKLLQLNRDFYFKHNTQTWSFFATDLVLENMQNPTVPLSNVACALQVIKKLENRLPVSVETIKSVVPKINLAGRLELISQNPRILMDVAHNPHAAEYLSRAVTGPVRCVFAALEDKAVAEMVSFLQKQTVAWYIASITDTPRGMSAKACLAKVVVSVPKHSCYTFDSVANALVAAIADLQPSETVLVWGSFHTVAAAMKYLKGRS